jgi:hypothetical protein
MFLCQTTEDSCPLCGSSSNRNGTRPVIARRDMGYVREVSCRTCGRYSIDIDACRYIESHPASPYLPAYIRSKLPLEADMRDAWPEDAAPVALEPATIPKLLADLPVYSIDEKQALLLQRLALDSSSPGRQVYLNLRLDYPINWSLNAAELRFHLLALKESKCITLEISDLGEETATVEVTPTGWKAARGGSSTRATSQTAFVAMSFSAAMRPTFDHGIKLAIQRAGFRPVRTDADIDIGRIDARIISEIRRARFVVADVTEQRQGVYFEAGFAIGIDVPVFWCVRQDDLPNVHFDTRQYNHLVWTSPEQLALDLESRITAVIGLPPAWKA